MLAHEMNRTPLGSARPWWRPDVAHYGSLVVALAVILVIGRDQWFFGDDWAILAPRLDDEVLAPHVGHFNLIPALVFPAVRNLVGLHSYLPFLFLAVAMHLVVVHLAWRILGRVGVHPWIATALAGVLALLGGAAENLLWAFQFGFMGAIALGLGVVLLFDGQRRHIAPIIVLSVLAPMFSGTAIPLLAAAAILGWMRRGFVRTLLVLLPAAAVYLSWYLIVARSQPAADQGFSGPADLVPGVVYAGIMLAAGLGRALPHVAVGVPAAIAVIVAVIVMLRRRLPAHAPALALAAGAVVFIALTTFSRLDNGANSAASERYAYVTIVMLLPVIGLAVTWVAARSRAAFVASVAVICALAVWNAVVLGVQAQRQLERETASRTAILTGLDALIAHPEDEELLEGMPDRTWAPDLLGSDLLRLYRSGAIERDSSP